LKNQKLLYKGKKPSIEADATLSDAGLKDGMKIQMLGSTSQGNSSQTVCPYLFSLNGARYNRIRNTEGRRRRKEETRAHHGGAL
jgi:hypothetical protein